MPLLSLQFRPFVTNSCRLSQKFGSLGINSTANWNHENQQTKEYYLDYYMAKNLYYFVCKKFSRFNPESDYRPNPAEEDIRLIPVGFVNDNWKCDTTTDPDVFWARPSCDVE